MGKRLDVSERISQTWTDMNLHVAWAKEQLSRVRDLTYRGSVGRHAQEEADRRAEIRREITEAMKALSKLGAKIDDLHPR